MVSAFCVLFNKFLLTLGHANIFSSILNLSFLCFFSLIVLRSAVYLWCRFHFIRFGVLSFLNMENFQAFLIIVVSHSLISCLLNFLSLINLLLDFSTCFWNSLVFLIFYFVFLFCVLSNFFSSYFWFLNYLLSCM